VVNFLILLAIGYWAVKNQVNPGLAARRAAVETEIAEAKRLFDSAQAMHNEYTERLGNLKTELATLRTDLVKQGEAERDRLIADAHTQAERMRAEGTQMIEQEMRSLSDDLRREAMLAAVQTAEQTVKKNVTAADQHRLVDDLIQALESEAKHVGSPGAHA
jgi:F-type H+-transporting ATPase subunit b